MYSQSPADEVEDTTPKYDVIYDRDFSLRNSKAADHNITRPSNLVITVELPGVVSANSVTLAVSERRMTLNCGDKYKLDVSYNWHF